MSASPQRRKEQSPAKEGAVPRELFDKLANTGTIRVIAKLHVSATPEGDLPNRESVRVQRRTITDDQDLVLSEISNTDQRVLHKYATIPFIALEASKETLLALEASSHISFVSEDIELKPSLFESVSIVGADQAFSAGFDGTGWTVVVIDSGVDTSHVFLSGKVVEEACFSNGDCPNGQARQYGAGAGVPCTFDTQTCSHGTHVAGIVAGKLGTIGGKPISGIAKGANLISLRTGNRNVSTGKVVHSPSDVAAALDYVMTNLKDKYKIASINMSLGGGQYFTRGACDSASENQVMKAAMNQLLSVGIASVVSSGNDGYLNAMSTPACLSEAVSVGNSTKQDQVSPDSNAGSYGPDFLTPGTNIYSSLPYGSSFDYRSGTSMAAPHAAAAWAVLKQKAPNATVNQIFNALYNTGLFITDNRPGNGFQYPRIQIKKALDSLGGTTTQNPTFTITMSKPTYTTGDTITATEFKIANPNSSPTPVKLRVWLKIPNVGEIDLINFGGDCPSPCPRTSTLIWVPSP